MIGTKGITIILARKARMFTCFVKNNIAGAVNELAHNVGKK